jgi:hypothetical protein
MFERGNKLELWTVVGTELCGCFWTPGSHIHFVCVKKDVAESRLQSLLVKEHPMQLARYLARYYTHLARVAVMAIEKARDHGYEYLRKFSARNRISLRIENSP